MQRSVPPGAPGMIVATDAATTDMRPKPAGAPFTVRPPTPGTLTLGDVRARWSTRERSPPAIPPVEFPRRAMQRPVPPGAPESSRTSPPLPSDKANASATVWVGAGFKPQNIVRPRSACVGAQRELQRHAERQWLDLSRRQSPYRTGSGWLACYGCGSRCAAVRPDTPPPRITRCPPADDRRISTRRPIFMCGIGGTPDTLAGRIFEM